LEKGICAGGLRLDTWEHIRPLLQSDARIRDAWLSTGMLKKNGGCFAVGSIVDLGKVTPYGKKPHVEDHHFDEKNVHWIGELDYSALWQRIEPRSKPDLKSIFGPDIHLSDSKNSESCVVAAGHGECSLGYCYTNNSNLRVSVNSDYKGGQVRMEFKEDSLGMTLDLKLNDIRYYEEKATGWVPNHATVEELQRELKVVRLIILAVGLTREHDGCHWVQVNNIYVEPPWPQFGVGSTAD
jgi:hypothetical protein